jgi:A/G-specific adenine glycosylase
VPDDPERFRALPGVGRYTVGAVLSIAFDRPLPVLDGNVARVLARLFAIPAAARDPRGARARWDQAALLVPMRDPGDWNQALMELGARVCTPRVPRCTECPVRGACRARALGRVEDYPPVPARARTRRVRWAAALIRRGDRVLMTRREGPLLAGLWEPPVVELEGGDDRATAKRALVAALRRLGVVARLEPSAAVVRHAITHRAIEVEVWEGVAGAEKARGRARSRSDARWVAARAPGLPITGLARKLGLGSRNSLRAGR